jgi:large subunit ribosomal protein L21
MYAVIRVGGKQERVRPGDVVEVEFMKLDPGSSVEFEPIVVFDDDGKAHVGKDLSKAKVVARLAGDKKGDKIRVFKYRPKSGYRRTQGHRQLLTLLEIDEVALSPSKKATRGAEKAGEQPAKKPAAKKSAPKEPAAKKSTAKKSTAKKPAAKKPAAKKPAAKKSTAKKTTAKKSTARKKS